MQSRRPTLIVIGNGMVGHHLIKTLADNQHINQFKVIVFCEEPHPAYDRVQLSRFFSGFSAEDLVMVDQQAYQQWDVTLMLNERVVALVIPQPNTLTTTAKRPSPRFTPLVNALCAADRLQRTATWMNNLEGGLDYLKQVVINDSLSIGAEFEAQMQALIDFYQCKWKKHGEQY